MRIDVHQHLWTEGLYGVLARRHSAPRMIRRSGDWSLELAGEVPFAMPAEPVTAERHVAGFEAAGIDVGVVALSTALGVETLPGEEAREIIATWAGDVDEFPGSLRGWGSVPLEEVDADDVDRALSGGRPGITLPATALSTPSALERVGPLLDRLTERDGALFVHPGPATPGAWLPVQTSYLASLSEAWHAWALHGRSRHPRLRVVFAALAGLAPLHAERLDARLAGAFGRAAIADDLTFYDTSTYGPVAVGAMISAVGGHALVNGSDHPYAQAVPPEARHRRAIVEDNPAALLGIRSAAVTA